MSDERIDQPSWDADAVTWRKHAGQLRQRIGAAKADALQARTVAVEARERAAELHEDFLRLMSSKHRDGATLDALEADLAAGDVPAAMDRLAVRRRKIELAREKRS